MHSNRKLSIQTLFVTVQTVLYAGFLALDLTDGSIGLSVSLKYSIILLCFCYALFGAGKSTFYSRQVKRLAVSSCLLQAALFFTVISDLFILILDYYIYGVLTFILAQELYCLRLVMLLTPVGSRGKTGVAFLKRILLQLTAALVICLFLALAGVGLDGLLVVSVFYFICICMNVVTAFTLVRREPGAKGNLLYAIGMLLFLLCDINVGLFNLSGFIPMQESIYSVLYSISSILMWTFYAPAQVLIAISSRYEGDPGLVISDKKS